MDHRNHTCQNITKPFPCLEITDIPTYTELVEHTECNNAQELKFGKIRQRFTREHLNERIPGA